jgi:hypothetical protein
MGMSPMILMLLEFAYSCMQAGAGSGGRFAPAVQQRASSDSLRGVTVHTLSAFHCLSNKNCVTTQCSIACLCSSLRTASRQYTVQGMLRPASCPGQHP